MTKLRQKGQKLLLKGWVLSALVPRAPVICSCSATAEIGRPCYGRIALWPSVLWWMFASQMVGTLWHVLGKRAVCGWLQETPEELFSSAWNAFPRSKMEWSHMHSPHEPLLLLLLSTFSCLLCFYDACIRYTLFPWLKAVMYAFRKQDYFNDVFKLSCTWKISEYP